MGIKMEGIQPLILIPEDIQVNRDMLVRYIFNTFQKMLLSSNGVLPVECNSLNVISGLPTFFSINNLISLTTLLPLSTPKSVTLTINQYQ